MARCSGDDEAGPSSVITERHRPSRGVCPALTSDPGHRAALAGAMTKQCASIRFIWAAGWRGLVAQCVAWMLGSPGSTAVPLPSAARAVVGGCVLQGAFNAPYQPQNEIWKC